MNINIILMAIVLFVASCFALYGTGLSKLGAVIVTLLVWLGIGLVWAGIALLFSLP
jgi:hypothetical protein